jgi:hypothetical protein
MYSIQAKEVGWVWLGGNGALWSIIPIPRPAGPMCAVTSIDFCCLLARKRELFPLERIQISGAKRSPWWVPTDSIDNKQSWSPLLSLESGRSHTQQKEKMKYLGNNSPPHVNANMSWQKNKSSEEDNEIKNIKWRGHFFNVVFSPEFW